MEELRLVRSRAPCGSQISAPLAVHATQCDYCAGYLEREREEIAARRTNVVTSSGFRLGPRRVAKFLVNWRDRRKAAERRSAIENRRGRLKDRRSS